MVTKEEKQIEERSDLEVVYIVTGVTGHLGNVVVRRLLKQGKHVVGLLLPEEKCPFPDMEAVRGNVREKKSLRPLFRKDKKQIVIHCAGLVSISSFDGLELWNTNVIGTRNMADLALEYGVEKFIYVSSVHAIQEQPNDQTITETQEFCTERVHGDYAKTKCSATNYVLETVKRGLPACIVHPSGIIGPYGSGKGQMSVVLRKYLKGQLPAGVLGGYDFVDVRDVAKGILACCDYGKTGECYILSGHYYTVKEFLRLAGSAVSRKPPFFYIPPKWLETVSGCWEQFQHKIGKKTVFTPYALYTLNSNGNFSHAKATQELRYHPRSKEQTIRDMVRWILQNFCFNNS